MFGIRVSTIRKPIGTWFMWCNAVYHV